MPKPKKGLKASLCETLRRLLPGPVREENSTSATTLEAGDPGLVAVRLGEEGVEVSVFGVRWDGPHTPVPDHRPLAAVAWAALGSEAEAAVAVHMLARAAVVIRRATFRRCRHCGKDTPPEWWHGEDACQGCAERHLGVVH
jgi:hypothetical protein